MNGCGSSVLGRGPSPGLVDNQSLGSLTANSILNGGFQSLSSSTSPILSQATGTSRFPHVNTVRFEMLGFSYINFVLVFQTT